VKEDKERQADGRGLTGSVLAQAGQLAGPYHQRLGQREAGDGHHKSIKEINLLYKLTSCMR
jgi:hypothetical protein